MLVVGPEELRADVVDRLRAVAGAGATGTAVTGAGAAGTAGVDRTETEDVRA